MSRPPGLIFCPPDEADAGAQAIKGRGAGPLWGGLGPFTQPPAISPDACPAPQLSAELFGDHQPRPTSHPTGGEGSCSGSPAGTSASHLLLLQPSTLCRPESGGASRGSELHSEGWANAHRARQAGTCSHPDATPRPGPRPPGLPLQQDQLPQSHHLFVPWEAGGGWGATWATWAPHDGRLNQGWSGRG